MDLLGIFGQGKAKKSLGTCIPEARKKKLSKEAGEVEPEIGQGPNSFKVTGVFQAHESITLQGKMLEGCVKAGDKIDVLGKKMTVEGISIEQKSVEQIREGQSGALFLKARSFPILKAGTILEF